MGWEGIEAVRNLLVHLEAGPGLESVLACAGQLARRFDAHLEGLHLQPAPHDIIAAGADGFVAAAPELVAGFEREASQRAQAVRERFLAFCREQDIPLLEEAPTAPGLSALFRLELAAVATTLASRTRLFDLVVLGRPRVDAPTPSTTALEAALFEGGRPLLVAPPTPPRGVLGERVVIAWNGSTESARTLTFAMPLLARARELVVLTIEEGMVPGPTGEELATALLRHGLPVRHRHRRAEGAGVGAAILAEAHALKADLLVKGAYTHSRLRQMIFGGATSHLLQHADLPMLMAN